MPLPPYYLNVILTSKMACIVAMMMYRGGILQVLFESFSKGPRRFPLCTHNHRLGDQIGTNIWPHFC